MKRDDGDHVQQKTIRGEMFDGVDTTVRKHHHRDDPETSKEAAIQAMTGASATCQRVLDYIAAQGQLGCTDEEGQRELEMFSFPKRRCDLFKAGRLRDSGLRRKSSQDSDMVVWVATLRPLVVP